LRTGTAIVWDLRAKRSLKTIQFHRGAVTAALFMKNASQLLTVSEDTTLRVTDLRTYRELLCTSPGHVALSSAVTDGNLAAVGCQDGHVRVVSLNRGEEIADLATSGGAAVTCVAASARGNRLAAGCEDNSVYVWEV
jgi:WD40 repeat protein